MLTSWAAMLFLIPVAIALLMWALIATGIVDGHHDGDHGSAFGDALDLITAGAVPSMVGLTLALFVFGIVGLFCLAVVSDIAADAAALWGPLVSLPVAMGITIPTTRLVSRSMRGLFVSYGHAHRPEELLGCRGVVDSAQVTPTFGTARVTLHTGASVQVAIRDLSHDGGLQRGDAIVIVDIDASSGWYMVEPLDPTVRLRSSKG